VAKAQQIEGLNDPGRSFRAVARMAVGARAGEVFAHAERVLDLDDVEGVHDMRVATRRLRAVLEVFAPAFDRESHRGVLRDVKALADALGARRDPDVHLAGLRRVALALPEEDQAGLDLLAQRLRVEQAQGNHSVARALDAMRSGRLEERLRALVGDDGGPCA
jgi:CHAD domain-containing protein